MNWIDIASIVFVCVTMNHLGLISKIEQLIRKRLPIVNCQKCGSFWATLIYSLWGMTDFYKEFPIVLAISFFASYTAIWLELIEACIDKLYLRIYETITTDTDNAPAADPERGSTAGSLPEL